MGNMSYCRFENTYGDLKDCLEALSDAGGVNELEKDAGQYEKKYVRKLVDLCKEIVDDFGEYDEEYLPIEEDEDD